LTSTSNVALEFEGTEASVLLKRCTKSN